jgi:transposase-like protein
LTGNLTEGGSKRVTSILLPVSSVNHELPKLLKEAYEELEEAVVDLAERRLNVELRKQVDAGLRRGWYERRKKAKGRSRFQCQGCGSRWRGQFSRNGYRERGLDLAIGRLRLNVPRVVCSCGGSVSLHLEGLKPRQRMGDDIQALVAYWTELAYSVRQMKQAVDNALKTSVGLRSLNERFQAVVSQVPGWRSRWLQDVPPVVMLDAVWVTLMEETGEIKRDKLGRQRSVKKRVKKPVMIALGIWPEEGRKKVLDWEVGDGPGEDKVSWLRLLNRLEERGLHPHFGLQLFITDGDQALIFALEEIFWDVPRQRCVFHKIRNVLDKLSIPEVLQGQKRRAYRRKFVQQLARIWRPATRQEAIKRYNHFCQRWRPYQPQAISTLEHDFQDTLTFYDLLQLNRLWLPLYLRTTSLLERLNRKVRARMRKAGAFHSYPGLHAMLAQVLIDDL